MKPFDAAYVVSSVKTAVVVALLSLGVSIQAVGLTDCCCGHSCPTEDRHGSECPGDSCTHLEPSQKADLDTAPNASIELIEIEPSSIELSVPRSIRICSSEPIDTGPPLVIRIHFLLL